MTSAFWHATLVYHPATDQKLKVCPCCCLTGLPPPAERAAALPHALPSLMLFAICWSVGGSCDKAGRALFDSFVRDRVGELVQVQSALQQLPNDALMPASAPVYDWCFDLQVRCRLTRLLVTIACGCAVIRQAAQARVVACVLQNPG